MKYPLLGSTLNGITPSDLAERGFGTMGVFHRSPPLGEWRDAGEEALQRFVGSGLELGMRLSWHYPVLYLPQGRHPALPDWFNPDEGQRIAERQRFDLDVAAAARCGADHVVTHFTTYPSSQPPESLDARWVTETLEWMADVQDRHRVAICIECFGDPLWLAIRAARYGLYICLDSGHLLRSSQERGSRYLDDVNTLGPLVRVVHLWNTRGLAGEHHVPYHPDQRPADGWAPILALLSRILQHRRNFPIVAEPSYSLHQKERFWDGMLWLGDWLAKRQAA
jgi:sugar phosphate isomerase/epimerase